MTNKEFILQPGECVRFTGEETIYIIWQTIQAADGLTEPEYSATQVGYPFGMEGKSMYFNGDADFVKFLYD